MSRIAVLALLLAACGGASGAASGTDDTSASAGAEVPGTPEHNLLGLGPDAVPELAPIWPALSEHAATEVVETVRVGSSVTHCVHVAVSGDLASAAFEAWARGADEAHLTCSEGSAQRCAGDDATELEIRLEASEEITPLDAIAAEVGVPPEPIATADACAVGISTSALASIDARLHLLGMLEPWHELHDRLGSHRLAELRWSRAADGGHELVVTYRGDDEAFELADQWARESGWTGVEGQWSLEGAPVSLALESRTGPPAVVELRLSRAP